jgi:hypothetical protein
MEASLRALTGHALASVLALAACGTAPEEASGRDAHLSGAEPIKLGKLATGDLDRDAGDTTDWRAVDLPAGGAWRLTFATEPSNARVALGVYDRTGELLGAATFPADDEGEAVIDFASASAGRHHLRLMHQGGGKNTWGAKVEAREAASSGPKRPVID